MSRSVKEMRLIEAAIEGDANELATLRAEAERLRGVADELEACRVDAILPLLGRLREDAMRSLLDADDIHKILRYQGEARAYTLLASKPGEIQEEIEAVLAEAAHVRERMESRADAGNSGDR